MRSKGYGTWSVSLSVCLSVCYNVFATTRNETTKQRYQKFSKFGDLRISTAFESYGVKTK